jgi:predicted MFS family arabinose efflux permease
MFSLGLALAGPANAGKVIAWVGMAMFAALASGAPLGTVLYGFGGFASIGIATALIPMATIGSSSGPEPAAARHAITPSQGCACRLDTGIWFGAQQCRLRRDDRVQLLALRRAQLESCMALVQLICGGLVVARLFLGHLPDRLGGARVALISAAAEAIGLALIWSAPSRFLAVVGALLTGFGYALVYPGFGVEAVRRAPPESRGLAMGAYTAFLDVALGFGSPALGLVAGRNGLSSVFLAGALLVFGAAVIALRLLYKRRRSGDPTSVLILPGADDGGFGRFPIPRQQRVQLVTLGLPRHDALPPRAGCSLIAKAM